ncbi:RNA-directed DNA polymerase from mobile element jockey [Eumeta japonica]|uniref:RNA-directed DNA polymerase from mobile element jockey n=1 Tax=Eumeta variegata TaxID=151549 RepID=A0A4C1X7J9_EUMVA|nr:RNA-directed DNA polymerase from mobile element jockey [Eumeta japonica]
MAANHNQGRRTVRVFLDTEKALDRVWHPRMLYKLQKNTQILPALVRTVALFLEGRSFFVAVEDVTSDPRPIHAGVPQGSCLSPCLYGMYTDDIPTLVDQLQDWEEDVVLALYAYDSAYLHNPVVLTWLWPSSRGSLTYCQTGWTNGVSP